MPTPSQCTGWTEVKLRQISPTWHVIITSQDALNIKSQTGDGPDLPILPELNYETFTDKNPLIPSEADSRKSLKYYARRNEYLLLFPPFRKPHKNLRDTHTRSNAVTCVSTSVCCASVLGSQRHMGRGKWRLPHPPWYAGVPCMIIVSQIKNLKWHIELKTKV